MQRATAKAYFTAGGRSYRVVRNTDGSLELSMWVRATRRGTLVKHAGHFRRFTPHPHKRRALMAAAAAALQQRKRKAP